MISPPDDAADACTGLPWPRSWRGVYALVLAAFVVVVAALTWLSGMNT